MTLEPDRYQCPDHHVDVTGQVTAKASPDSERGGRVYGDFLRRRRPQGPEPFEVIVTCPGADGAEPHLLTCSGTRTP